MIILKGKIVSSVQRTFQKKNGEMKTIRDIAVNSGQSLQNFIVEVPVNYEPKTDDDGNVKLEITKIESSTWDHGSKSFIEHPVKLFIEN